MTFDELDRTPYEIEGQITLEDLTLPAESGMIGVHELLAEARKSMSVHELKATACAMTHIRFKEEAPQVVLVDKHELADAVGIHSDADHLSQDLHEALIDLRHHSEVHFSDAAQGLYEDGGLIDSVRFYKNVVRFRFSSDYLPLLGGLQNHYLMLYAADLYRLSTDRAILLYERLRAGILGTSGSGSYTVSLGVKALKELWGIPKEGPGSYMRSSKNGGFNRSAFEARCIDPVCRELARTDMIRLVIQPDGKAFRKITEHGYVKGYAFDFLYSARPHVADAGQVKAVQQVIDKNPEMLKVAKNILEGQKKVAHRAQKNDFPHHKYSDAQFDELEKRLLSRR